jgi:ribonuclease D
VPGPAAGELAPEAEAVFERLRAWRTAVAKELGMPPYVIFHDSTLRQIAAAPPVTLAGLAMVNGVGETKLAKYGQQILEILAEDGKLPSVRRRSTPAGGRGRCKRHRPEPTRAGSGGR